MNNTTPDPPPEFYPAYCFALSPTFHTWAKLTAADVHALTTRPGFEGQNLYFHTNHPIKWIRLVGAIVALDSYDRRLVLTLDDSSGATIEVTVAKSTPPLKTTASTPAVRASDTAPPSPPQPVTVSPTGNAISLDGVDVGSIVKVKGGIGEFRGTRQLCLERIARVESTDAEVRAWEEMVRFRMEVLAVPWVVPEGERRRLLEMGEGKGKGEKGKRRMRAGDKGERGKGEEGSGERRRRDREGKREEEGRGGGEAKERRPRDRHRTKRRESDKENAKGDG